MLSGSTFVSVVQTIPTGLLKARYTCFCSIGFVMICPSTSTWSPSSTFVPISGTFPLILTFPSSISLSATLLEQQPTSLKYLFILVAIRSKVTFYLFLKWMDNLKKILILALAIALGLFLFRIIIIFLGVFLNIVLNVIVIAALIAGGIYLYRKFKKQSFCSRCLFHITLQFSFFQDS